MTSNAPHLKDVMRASILLTELQHLEVQRRLVTALLAISMMFNMLDPAALLLGDADSIIYRAAMATSMRPHGAAYAFSAFALGLVPYLAMQFGCWPCARRRVTKLTCLVLALSGVLWAFLAWRCVHLDLGASAPLVFTRNALGALGFSLALAFSLNAEQLRCLMERPA